MTAGEIVKDWSDTCRFKWQESPQELFRLGWINVIRSNGSQFQPTPETVINSSDTVMVFVNPDIGKGWRKIYPI